MGSVKVEWVRDRLMIGSDSNGQSITIGFTKNEKPKRMGIKPSELLLVSLASCTCYDVVEILEKQREPLKNLHVECSSKHKQEPPYTFTEIHVHYFASGDINPKKLEKAIRLSEEKYCSVMATLRLGVPITTAYSIINE